MMSRTVAGGRRERLNNSDRKRHSVSRLSGRSSIEEAAA